MEEIIKAGDIMIPLEKYPHIPYWFSLRQAMAEMEHSELNIGGRISLPRVVLVFDEQYRLMGLVRRRDILRGLEPEFLLDKPISERRKLFDIRTHPTHWEVSFDKIIEATRKRAERPISDIMRPIEQTADYNDHIFQVIYDMNINRVNLLPVLKEGRVVGVVRSVDVFHEICKLML